MKKIMTNVLRGPNGQGRRHAGQTDSASREPGSLRKNPKETLEIKRTVTGLADAFDGLTSRLGMAEGRLSELGDVSVETSKTQKQRQKRKNRIAEVYATTTKARQRATGRAEGRKRNRDRRSIRSNDD